LESIADRALFVLGELEQRRSHPAADLSQKLLPVFLVRVRLFRRPGATERVTHGLQTGAERPGFLMASGKCEVGVVAYATVHARLHRVGRRGAEIELPAEFDDVLEPFLLGGGG